MIRIIVLIAALAIPLSLTPVYAVTISTVPVGDPGNANDPATGNLYGGVSYNYRIGTYEVTVGQYSAFLTAVAATDTYALYNPSMAIDFNIAGIARSGPSGGYTYSVIGSANHPVTYVNWGDAARFANWLHHGQPSGPQNASTTENGAYALNGATSIAALNGVARNAGATWFIPSENEWYKAAYFDPNKPGGPGYWSYPTRTNDTPFSDQPPGSDAPIQSDTANFGNDDGISNGYNDGYAVTGSAAYSASQNYLTDVGAYMRSASPYGTFDQAGNVFEWNEALNGPRRGLRGGAWGDVSFGLLASSPAFATPTDEHSLFGFRVAYIPEPSALALGLLGGLGAYFLARKRHRN
jgi:formylglycine-generating enzyme required for sulfatase activity